MNRVITLTEHILQAEKRTPGATGQLTLLLEHIAEAGKIIASHVKRSGLAEIIGRTGTTNAYDEEVQKLDEFSNTLLVDILASSGLVYAIGSEELEEIITYADSEGDYVVYIDPLDGSSNIDVNVSIGTIFSIFMRGDSLLQKGASQVAAGYILYGSSVMMVYTTGDTVDGFTLDPAIGSFLLSNPSMTIPASCHEYSINEGNSHLYDTSIQRYLTSLKTGDKPYRLRYVGSLIADVHRILIRGGIFLYPHDAKNPAGKLRLMHELNAVSMLVEAAGGLSRRADTGAPLLNTIPSHVHMRLPVVMGSRSEVENFFTITHNKE